MQCINPWDTEGVLNYFSYAYGWDHVVLLSHLFFVILPEIAKFETAEVVIVQKAESPCIVFESPPVFPLLCC